MDAPRRLLALAVLAAGASAQTGPPEMTVVRHDEDYSYLWRVDERETWWEHCKHVSFTPDSRWHWSVGAEVRARFEGFENDAWDPEGDREYLWLRALPYLDVARDDGLRAFAQLVAAFESGDEAGASPVDEDRLDLLQAFVDVPLGAGPPPPLVLRGGRQVLAYGSERLISARYGPNVLRSFDAATAIAHAGAWRVDALWGRPVANELGAFDDRADPAREFWTLYATGEVAGATGLDLYYIGFEDDEASFEQGSAREQRHTLGTRIFGSAGAWDWNCELMGQTGSFGEGAIRAWSVASDTGVVLEALPLAPRLGLKADVISGDRDASDPELETFNPLFPKGKYFGEAGLVGPYNLIDLHPSLEFPLSERWGLSLATVLYWRQSTGDGIYGPSGDLLRASGGSDERFVGTQYDLVVDYAASRVLDASLSLSTFVPGAFLEDTGSSATTTFLGLELRFRF